MYATMRAWLGKNIRWIAHVSALAPLVLLGFDALTDTIGANPIQEITLRTGKPALLLLISSLACTPFNTVFGFPPIIKVRRALGLYAFLYVCVHFLIFTLIDYGLDTDLVYEAIFEKPYALVGFTALVLLLPLAVTSTKAWQKRLRKKWKSLHKLAYVVTGLAVVHYVWLVKSDYREPLAWGALVVVLLVLRLSPVKRSILMVRSRIRTKRAQTVCSSLATSAVKSQN